MAPRESATDERHEAFVAGRHPSVVDVGIDTIGALIALVGHPVSTV
jgi:VanZ family protein